MYEDRPMPTLIVFAGHEVSLKVDESIHEVQRQKNAGAGDSFPLTLGSGEQVYVNPETIAYWYEPK